MSLIAALDDVKPDQVHRKGVPGKPYVTEIQFFKPSSDKFNSPSAILAHHDPGRVQLAHFHVADQFQLVTKGKGRFGRHEIAPFDLHFVRAYTAYGPVQSDEEIGLSFM